jgi:hypothetical protein
MTLEYTCPLWFEGRVYATTGTTKLVFFFFSGKHKNKCIATTDCLWGWGWNNYTPDRFLQNLVWENQDHLIFSYNGLTVLPSHEDENSTFVCFNCKINCLIPIKFSTLTISKSYKKNYTSRQVSVTNMKLMLKHMLICYKSHF